MPVETVGPVTGQIRVEASRETIFPFLVQPEQMIRWMGITAEAEAVPGGVYRVTINEAFIASGEFVEVDPPNRVLFSWGWEQEGALVGPGQSTVEITLEEDGDGTLVRLMHHGLPEEARESHAHGWHHFMPRLAEVAAGNDPGPDEWAVPPDQRGINDG